MGFSDHDNDVTQLLHQGVAIHQEQEVYDDPRATWIDPDNDVERFRDNLKDEPTEVQVASFDACDSVPVSIDLAEGHVNPMRTGVEKPDDRLLNVPTLTEKKPLAENGGREKLINKCFGRECTVLEKKS